LANLQNIRRRINSVKSTQKVTKAMKMVSASKLRRAQEAAEAARPYADKMAEMFAGLSIDPEQTTNPLLMARTGKKAAVVVVTPDRGLCGGLNANTIKLAHQQVRELEANGHQVSVVGIGRKGRDYFRRREIDIPQEWTGLLAAPTYGDAEMVGKYLVDSFLAESFDKVVLVYSRFKSVISQEPSAQVLLPISAEGGDEGSNQSFMFEPSDEEVLGTLLPKYIETRLFQALLESAASEHGARMTAMDAASRNAGEVIDKLTLIYNRSRQEAVTSELLDIIGGVEALNA
jgi:F-type H+-transporting ATPase subunit gamma